jgi:hypothetical protein
MNLTLNLHLEIPIWTNPYANNSMGNFLSACRLNLLLAAVCFFGGSRNAFPAFHRNDLSFSQEIPGFIQSFATVGCRLPP